MMMVVVVVEMTTTIMTTTINIIIIIRMMLISYRYIHTKIKNAPCLNMNQWGILDLVRISLQVA
jgi:hypothetical protein